MDIMQFWKDQRKAIGLAAVAILLVALKKDWVTAELGEWLWPTIIGATGLRMLDLKSLKAKKKA